MSAEWVADASMSSWLTAFTQNESQLYGLPGLAESGDMSGLVEGDVPTPESSDGKKDMLSSQVLLLLSDTVDQRADLSAHSLATDARVALAASTSRSAVGLKSSREKRLQLPGMP